LSFLDKKNRYFLPIFWIQIFIYFFMLRKSIKITIKNKSTSVRCIVLFFGDWMLP
jgi:hypothetical protein